MDKFYLNDIEKNELIKLNENLVAKNALQKLFLEEIYSMGVLKEGLEPEDRNWAYALGGKIDNASMTNEELGSLLKATVQGIAALERSFNRLSEFKREEKEEEKPEHNIAE